ncbi:MAG TPA: hypothetical protein VKQ34_05310 [Candidatus Saccharimonadales bacterium]|nr:hypothetical protein [Candidatus Saccharimonadales bacterium]
MAGNIVRQFALGEPVVGVYFEGTAQQLTHEADQQTAAACIKERLRADDSIVQEAKDPAGHQFYKITVTNWYVFGKFNTERGQKYQLSWGTPN